MGLEQVVHILGQAGAAGPVLPYPLPEGEEEVGAVLMLEQQIDLINIDQVLLPSLRLRMMRLNTLSSTTSMPMAEAACQITDVVAENSRIGIRLVGLAKVLRLRL